MDSQWNEYPKWWNKYEFFEAPSVYISKGLIYMTKKPNSSSTAQSLTNLSKFFKDLLESVPKEEFREQLFTALRDMNESISSKAKVE